MSWTGKSLSRARLQDGFGKSYLESSLLNVSTCVMKLKACKSENSAPYYCQLHEALLQTCSPFSCLCMYVVRIYKATCQETTQCLSSCFFFLLSSRVVFLSSGSLVLFLWFRCLSLFSDLDCIDGNDDLFSLFCSCISECADVLTTVSE